MYTERVESTGRLLALADVCVGKIRARMRAFGIPIHLATNTEAVAELVMVDKGQPRSSQVLDPHVLSCADEMLDEPAGSA